jgi:hypothetical protein
MLTEEIMALEVSATLFASVVAGSVVQGMPMHMLRARESLVTTRICTRKPLVINMRYVTLAGLAGSIVGCADCISPER